MTRAVIGSNLGTVRKLLFRIPRRRSSTYHRQVYFTRRDIHTRKNEIREKSCNSALGTLLLYQASVFREGWQGVIGVWRQNDRILKHRKMLFYIISTTNFIKLS